MRSSAVILALVAVSACGRAPERRQPRAVEAAGPVGNTTQNQTGQPTVDSSEAEAAVEVVRNYGALIEQQRWNEANGMWSHPASAMKFRSSLAQFAELHIETGNAGEPEGAAGSIYVTVPVIVYGDARDGQPLRQSADAILRRVNDVPGSTEAQRHWHIERIDWTG